MGRLDIQQTSGFWTASGIMAVSRFLLIFTIAITTTEGQRFSANVVPSNSKPEFISSVFVDGPSLQVGQDDGEDRGSVARRLRMSESCLACLCAASSDCDLSMRCVGQGQYCGPFLISKPYWLDAGSPVILGDSAERPESFQDCALDPICSAQTVRKYMTRFQKDCNGDGVVTCDDLALIHLMGPYGSECGNPSALRSGYFQKFQKCWNSVLRLSSAVSSFPASTSLDGDDSQRLT